MVEVLLEGIFFTSFFGFALLIINLSLLINHLSPSSEVFDSRDKAAHYHILGLCLWSFVCGPHFGWLQSKEVKFSTNTSIYRNLQGQNNNSTILIDGKIICVGGTR
jgi:hypothetical protein